MKKMYKPLFFAIVLSALSLNINSQNCLVAKYQLDGDAVDQSSNNYDGTINGTVNPTTDRNGNSGSALDFDGTSGYIVLPQDFDYEKRTINLWVYVDNVSTSGGRKIYGSDHAGLSWGSTSMEPFDDGGTSSIRFNVGGSSSGTQKEPITLNQWHMATIAVDSSLSYYYIDANLGSLGSNAFNSSSNGTSTATLGTNRNQSAFFDGKIDYVTIYDCALDGNAITNLMNSTSIAKYDQSVLVKYYPNPGKEELNIRLTSGTGNKTFKLSIFNAVGQKVLIEKLKDQSENTIHHNLDSGIYFTVIKDEDGTVINSEKLTVN